MIVLDASVVIAHLSSRHPHHARSFVLLDTEAELALHPVTLAETLVLPARERREELVLAALRRLGVEQLEPDAAEPQAVARLRAETGLGLPDCYVLHAAERLGAGLATFDERLSSIARERGVLLHDGELAI